jgi:TPR repeat protein
MSFAEKDSGKSFEEYLSLAKQGDAEAQLHLGNMYKKGKGVPEDYKEAVRWYRKAAEQGEAHAQMELGYMYRMGYDGEGVPQNYKEAVRWYRKAAEQGYVRTQYTLGVMYRDGEGVPKDLVASYAWLNISAAQGYKDFLDEVRASELRDRVAKKLPAAALAIAQELSMEYYKKYVEPFQ